MSIEEERHPIAREHILQKHVVQWAREAIAVPFKLLAFDRSKPAGQWTHMREKARGVQKATPDTLLIVKDYPSHIWCEFKRPGEKPDDDQDRMGRELQELGERWTWATSVVGYREALLHFGVLLRTNAEFLALHHDGRVATEIAKAEAKAGAPKKPTKPRAPRESASRTRKWAAIQRSMR